MRLAAGLLSLSLFAGIATAAPVPPPVTPVAVELFTSQGCSSCPPADALLEALSKQPNIIAITRPVTYWDRLGWKDTLASEANTKLQTAYAAKGLEGAGVYTPQAVVQGENGAVGSDKAGLARLIAAEKARPGPGILATRTADGGRSVAIGAGMGDGNISLLAVRGEVVVRIGSGENGGRTIRYVNVLVSETPVGNWNGKAAMLTIPGSAFRHASADRHVLIIRAGAAGRILAARYI
jgi:hypothetical protein